MSCPRCQAQVPYPETPVIRSAALHPGAAQVQVERGQQEFEETLPQEARTSQRLDKDVKHSGKGVTIAIGVMGFIGNLATLWFFVAAVLNKNLPMFLGGAAALLFMIVIGTGYTY